jgi:hypothetical protein
LLGGHGIAELLRSPEMGDPKLVALAIASAGAALAAGDAARAWEWIESVPREERPPELLARCLDRLSMAAGDSSDWALAERLAAEAAASALTPWRQERLGLLRRRTSTMDDHQWEVISAKVPAVTRLPSDVLQPEVAGLRRCPQG